MDNNYGGANPYYQQSYNQGMNPYNQMGSPYDQIPDSYALRSNQNQGNPPHPALKWVGLCFPIVGLILFLVFINSWPERAKQIGIFSLTGFIIFLIFRFLFMV